MKAESDRRNSYRVLGVMSGTSLDGIDLAFCTFEKTGERWSYSISAAETVPYPESWINRLTGAETCTAREFAQTDADYGTFLGLTCRDFLERNDLRPDFISSHGHTIFHMPEKHLTAQIGKGAYLAAAGGCTVISDFRVTDVALGGQGAPLVPVGDRLLFGDYDYCLNLGGFGNISYEENGKRIAFDTCPVNMVLNHFAQKAGHAYDEGGGLARSGSVDATLLQALNGISYYRMKPPKSLGKEWVLSEFMPLIPESELQPADVLATLTEHIAAQIASVVTGDGTKKMLVTGGGALNEFLVEKIRETTRVEVVVPDPFTVNFKEALIFAFLGVLRWREEPNCLMSVTGAARDSAGGAIWHY